VVSVFRRAMEIFLVGCLASWSYAAGVVRADHLEREADRKRALDGLAGRVIRQACERLGATFIKFGQVMSTRPDLFPPGTIEELRKLQDRLPPFPHATRRIEAAIGRPISEVFAELDETPLAAASVAQVHRGVLADGTVVAVKILRPDVRHNAARDGRLLTALAAAFERVSPGARHAEFSLHVAQFMHGILEQTDLRIEAAHQTRFRANFRKVKKVRFPKNFAELSGEHVLTMEFLEGRKIDEIPRAELPPDVPQRLRDVFLKMCFDDGFLHADLHPGNFVVQADGTLGIFDVGLAKLLSEQHLSHYIDFNRCLVMGDVADFMDHIRSFHAYVEGTVDWAELERDVARFNAEWRQRSTRDLEFGALIDEIFSIARRHGVRPVPEMTLMMVGLVTAEGIGKQLEPDVNSFQEVANYLLPVLARRDMLSPSVLAAAAALGARMEADRAAEEARAGA